LFIKLNKILGTVSGHILYYSKIVKNEMKDVMWLAPRLFDTPVPEHWPKKHKIKITLTVNVNKAIVFFSGIL